MLKKNKNIPDEYLYGSIFLKAIIESYNNHKYRKVIELGKLAKDSLAFRKSTEEVKDLIIFYYCSALAREKDDEFLNIVKYFQEDRNNAAHYQKYNFLRGFEERIKGQYDRAEEHFLNVSYKDINFSRVRRELVIVYSNLGKYDEAFNLAKENYEHNCENWYHIQGYFDCIVHSNNWKNNSDVIDKIMTDIEDLNMLKENIIYYQIKANYYAYIRHDIGQAFEIINQGKRSFRDNFYLFRDSFDIAVHFKNKQYMQNAYDELNKLYGNENDKKYALKTRKVYLDAMNGMSEIKIKKTINSIGGMSEQAKERLFNKVVVWKQSY